MGLTDRRSTSGKIFSRCEVDLKWVWLVEHPFVDNPGYGLAVMAALLICSQLTSSKVVRMSFFLVCQKLIR